MAHGSSDRASTWLHPDQIEQLRTACYRDCFRPPFRQRNDALVTLLYDTGFRVGELVELTLDHLDLDAGTVRRPTADGHDGRPTGPPDVLDLDPAHSIGTVRLLVSYLSDREGDGTTLFPSRDGGHLTPKAVRDVVTGAADTADVRPYRHGARGEPADVSPQTLRHSAAWRLLDVENRSMAAVRDRLGHTALSTTRSLYAGFDADGTRRDPDARTPAASPDAAHIEDVLDSVPDLLYAFDRDGQLIWWNDRMGAITGYTDAELADMHPLEFVARKDRVKIAEAIANVLEDEGIEQREAHLVTKDGESLPYEFTGAPLTDETGTVRGFAGVGRDIAARKRFERISDGFFALDTDWRVTYANARVEAMVDRSADDLVGTVIWDEFPDAVDTQIYDEFHTAMDTQEPATFDQYYPPLDAWFSVRVYPSESGLSVYVRDITDRKEHERELAYRKALLEAQAETTIHGLLVVDPDRNVLYHNERFLELWDIPESVAGTRSDEGLLEHVHDQLADADEFRETVEYLYEHPGKESRDTVDLGDGRRFDRYSAPVVADDTHYGRLWVFRDVTEQKERERVLEQQRTALAQLNQFNELVQDLVHAVVGESTRREVERTVCDRLATSEFYRAAWIGERAETTDSVVPRVGADVDLDAVPVTSTAGPDGDSSPGLARRAVETGDVCVARHTTDGRAVGADHDRLRGADINSALAVPIRHEDVQYGVLVVYAEQSAAFGDRQRASFGTLGETIGFAVAAAERKDALVAESVLELTLSVRDPEQFFIQAASRFDASVRLEGVAGRGDDTYIEYFTVTGASPAALREFAERRETVDHVRVVNDHASGCLCEVGIADSSITTIVAEYGGTVTDMTAGDEGGTIRIELPKTADIGRVIDALEAAVAGVELRAKRTVDRPMQSERRFRSAVTDRLTDKQRNALETAYFAGFFEQPRHSTGEAIAASLEISPSTFHQHLRVGLRKLVAPVAETPTGDA